MKGMIDGKEYCQILKHRYERSLLQAYEEDTAKGIAFEDQRIAFTIVNVWNNHVSRYGYISAYKAAALLWLYGKEVESDKLYGTTELLPSPKKKQMGDVAVYVIDCPRMALLK